MKTKTRNKTLSMDDSLWKRGQNQALVRGFDSISAYLAHLIEADKPTDKEIAEWLKKIADSLR